MQFINIARDARAAVSTRMRTTWLSVLAVGILAPVLFAAEGPLEVTLEPTRAVIHGVTRGGSLVVFARATGGVGRVYSETVAVDLIATDNARTGQITIDCKRELPPNAVWTVVDLTSGRSAVVTRGRAQGAVPVERGEVEFIARDEGKLRLANRIATVLIVRRGDGAWTGTFADGAAADEDGRMNGGSTIAPGKLKHLDRKSNRALGRLRKGDMVFVLDPKTLRVSTSSELGE
jgi:hypothetical protein